MHRAALILLLAAGAARAHPGHGAVDGHLHGYSPELVLLAILVVAWVAYRSR